MSQYCYSPLSSGHDSIRLLRLLPHEDETADIQCELFEYSLQNSCRGTHLYDALSYVWGNPDEKLPIFIHEHSFDVTVNLRAALSHLRNHSMERILWVDAICIDQENQEEKGHQIQFMARIYGQANRVVVWLGETADDSDLALEEIRVAGGKKPTNSSNNKTIQQAVLALLQRPWFRRIWILQEVAAARHVLIMCGSKKIDGYVFCLGVDSLKSFYEARPDLQGLIRSVTYLIREAIFRPDYSMGRSGRSSLDICPLGELMDMYHAHEATKRHDKVYALLGMSSDDLGKVNLLPDYRVPWEELLQRLAKYLLSEKISVETWGDKEIAVIKSKGCILGKVCMVRSDMAQDSRQSVDVMFKNIPGQLGGMGEWSAHWTLQVSAKSIQEGDLICLLQGASRPTIIRLRKDHFTIINIAAIPPENIKTNNRYIGWRKVLRLVQSFTRDFILVWDWENSSDKLQDLAEYETSIRTSNWVSEYPKTELENQLDRATQTWNVALILGDLREYKRAAEKLRDAVEGYETAFGEKNSYTLESVYGPTPLLWAAQNGYDAVVKLLLAKDGIDPDLKDNRYRQTPLSWAAQGGHEAIVKLLLETGQVDADVKDTKYGRTPLWITAMNGHEAVVKLLLKTGQVNADVKDTKYRRTPLWMAAMSGHKAVVKLLLETGQVDADVKDTEDGRTPLWMASMSGHKAVVKLLLETGQVDADVKDTEYGQTPLWMAAVNGHEAVVKLLLKTGQVNADVEDLDGQTPLWMAAMNGHEAVVKLLLETGQVDADVKDTEDGRTPLWMASMSGHEAVVKLLLETGQVDADVKDTEYGQTPLWMAAVNGHEAVVKLLLETGQVDADVKDTEDGRTPLWMASMNGHKAVVKLLLETGKVDIHSKGSGGRTILWWAAHHGHKAVVKLLQLHPNLSQ